MTNMDMPQHKNLLLVMDFTILVDPSVVIITIYLVCLTNAWEKSNRIHFDHMTYCHLIAHKPLS